MMQFSRKQKQQIRKIAQKYDLELILLFGSRVEGKIHKESDFDVAYSSSRDLGLMEEAQLIVDLAPVFQSENIDLANLKKVNPLLLYGIIKDCRILYEKKALAFASLRAYAFKKYVETKPLYEEKYKRLQETVKML